MKRWSIAGLLLLLLFVHSAEAQRGRRGESGRGRLALQRVHGPYLGADFDLFFQNGGGTVHDEFRVYDWDATAGMSGDGLKLGFGWDNTVRYGLQGTVGYRLNPMLGVEGSYCYYFKKTGATAEAQFIGDSEWSQSNIRLQANLYPVPVGRFSGFHLRFGLDWALFQVTEQIAQSGFTRTLDDGGGATGILAGAGFEHHLGRRAALGLNAGWCSTTFSGELFGGTDRKSYEMKLGGWMFDLGVRYYLVRPK